MASAERKEGLAFLEQPLGLRAHQLPQPTSGNLRSLLFAELGSRSIHHAKPALTLQLQLIKAARYYKL